MKKIFLFFPLVSALFFIPFCAFTADGSPSLGVDIKIADYDLAGYPQFAMEDWEYKMKESQENIKTIQDNVRKIENESGGSGGGYSPSGSGSGCDNIDFGDMECDDWMWMGCTGAGCAAVFVLIFWLTGTFNSY